MCNLTILDDIDHLIGNDPNMKKGYKFEALSFQTNCHINVRGPEFGAKPKRGEASTSPIMHVIIDPKFGNLSNGMTSNQMRAKHMVENSFHDFVGDDGSKGRLAYDVAAAEESSRCRGSRHNAVYQWNPFVESTRKSCMVLMELTSTKVDLPNGGVNRDLHGGYLLKSHILGHIFNKSGCRITMCGDKYRMPTKLCDPYILICGDTPSNVDHAFEIVADYISQHQRTCPCSYSR